MDSIQYPWKLNGKYPVSLKPLYKPHQWESGILNFLQKLYLKSAKRKLHILKLYSSCTYYLVLQILQNNCCSILISHNKKILIDMKMHCCLWENKFVEFLLILDSRMQCDKTNL